MLIRKEQLEVLAADLEWAFTINSTEFLKRRFPDWSKSKTTNEMTRFISQVIAFGKSFGIRSKRNLQNLMLLEVKYNVISDKSLLASVMPILTYPDRPEDVKLNYLHKQVIFFRRKNGSEPTGK